MTEAFKSLLESIEHLSTKEKALAAHCLLSSMDSKVDDADHEWLALAEARSSDLESGKVNPISWDEIKSDIIS